MKYIKLFEEGGYPEYSIFDIIAMSSNMACNVLRDEIMKDNPNIELIQDIFSLSASGVNSQDENGNSALSWAVKKGNTNIIRMILNNPDFMLINAKNDKDWTVLANAVSDKKEEIVELLLKHPNIDVNMKSNEWTPLHYAVNDQSDEIIELLLNKDGIDITIEDDENKTPWNLACEMWNNHICVTFPQLNPNYNQNL